MIGRFRRHVRGSATQDDPKASEHRANSSEEMYFAMLERLPYPMWIFDLDSLAFLEVNAAAVAHYGYSREEFLSMTIGDIRPTEDIPSMHQFATATAQGLDVGKEFRHIKKDGTLIHVLIRLSEITFKGRPARLVLVNDITDRVHAEEQLRMVMQHASDAIMVFDAKAKMLQANKAASEMLGIPVEELLGRSAHWFIDPENLVQTPLRHPEVKTRQTIRSERVVLRPDGIRRVVESNTNLLPDGRILVIARDVTERKEAETALRQNEEKYRTLFDSIDEGFIIAEVIFDAEAQPVDMVFLEANPAAERLSGIPNMTARRLREVDPNFESHWFEIYARVARTGKGERVEGYAAPLDAWFDVYAFPIGEDGSNRIAVIFQNVTERKRTAEEMRLAKEEAERASRAKSELLSRTSHELRTPLNAILGFGQILELDVEREEDRESVHQILTAGRHLLELINEVLDLSRIEEGQLRLSLEIVRVSEVVDAAVAMISPLAMQHGIQLEVCPKANTTVQADQQRLKQVLLNLLSNAVKYNRSGGHVRVSCQVDGPAVRIEVQDTGIGIPPEMMHRLFTPFDRLGVESRSSTEGTGLGLSLSKAITEAMGGSLSVQSVPGKGSTFTVTFPLADDSELEAPLDDGREEVPLDGSVATKTLLYIEDNLSNVRLVERVLKRQPNVGLLVAMQGHLGLEMARTHRPDLIMLDLNLPDVHGAQVLARLKEDPETREIPVVIVSADAMEAQMRPLVEVGAEDYLTKPFDLEKFFSVLDSFTQDMTT